MIYFKMASNQIRKVSTLTEASISYEQSELEEEDNFDFSIIFYQNIKNHGKNKQVNICK